MSNQVYKTAQGKIVDFGALVAENETIIAVGNCKVNARGDELGPGGKIVKTRNQLMEEHYATGAGGQVTPATMARSAAIAAAADAPPDIEDPMSEEEVLKLKKSSGHV